MRKNIKHPERIHYIEEDNKYACIKAVTPTFVKSTQDWNKVTCKNCSRKHVPLREHLKRLMRKTYCMCWTVGEYEKQLDIVLGEHKGEIIR